MDLIIEPVPDHPDPDDLALIVGWLDADNARKSGRQDQGDFAVLVRDPLSDDVIGGLWGVDDYGWASITYLYLPTTLRGQRIGERLMNEAEAIARRRGMVGILVGTFDFQARGFYEKCGFEIFGTLESVGTAPGQFFLKKRLPSS